VALKRATRSDDRPITTDRIIQIAEFRDGLRRFLHQTEESARRAGLTPQRYHLLLAIKGAPDGSERLSFGEIAQRLRLSPNTVTELCARTEEAGLIRREPSRDDQRVVYLRVTREGERRLAATIRENDDYRDELKRLFDELAMSFHAARRRR
jgi:DNA-binding MarR family transcriptional regulator